MLNHNRYQQIRIDIHTQTGGGCIHIAIGEEVGHIYVSCLTGQTGYDANRTQRGPLNHHRDYPLSFPRGCQLPNSRDHQGVYLHTCQMPNPDHNSNHTGQLILLQQERWRGPISISHITVTGLRGAAQARQTGQENTGRTDTIGTMEVTIESKNRKDNTNHHQGGRNPRVTYIMPEDDDKLSPLMKSHKEDNEWLGEQSGAILRRILHMLR